jgi:hypothetical protein
MHLYGIREITAHMAYTIVKEAVKEDIAEGYRNTNPKELRRICNDDVHFTSDISY